MKPKVHARKTLILLLVLPIALAASGFAQDQPVTMNDQRGLSHRVELHPQTGSARWIYDPAINVADLGLQSGMLSERTQPLLLEKLLAVFGSILQLTPDQTMLRKAGTDGTSWFVAFDQVVDGLPVVGTEIGYTVDPRGNVVALGATVYPDLDVATTPSLSKEAALAAARTAFAVEPLRVKDDGTLVILPLHEDQAASFYLAWRLRLFALTPLKDVTYFIDARDGTVLQDWSNLRHAHGPEPGGTIATVAPLADSTSRSAAASSAPLGGTLSGTVTGSYYPELGTDPPITTGFKTTEVEVYNTIGLRVFLGSTNTSGSWSTSYLASGSYTIHLPLQNEWVELHDANDNALEQVATVKWTPKSRPRASNNKTDFRPTHSVPPPGIGSPVIGVDVRDCRR